MLILLLYFQAFICFATVVAAATAAPALLGHGLGVGHVGHALGFGHAAVHARPAGQVTHQSVSKPFQGEHRSTILSKAFGAGIAAVADSPNRLHGARGVVAHAPVFGGVHAIAHPVAHAIARPVIAHAPVLAHPLVAHAAPVYPDVPSPYTYNYAVNDDYSGSRFTAGESADGAGTVTGSYSVALPDGRTQNVNYHANGYDGYVADVTYDGVPQYATAPLVAHAVAPAVHAVAHPAVGLIHG